MATKNERFEVIVRLATADVADGRGLVAKVQALGELVEMAVAGQRVPLSRRHLRDELQKVVTAPASGGRAAEAQWRALQTLKLLDAPKPKPAPALDPNQPAPRRHWPFDGSLPDLDGWEVLDAEDTVEDRARWRRNLEQHRPDLR